MHKQGCSLESKAAMTVKRTMTVSNLSGDRKKLKQHVKDKTSSTIVQLSGSLISSRRRESICARNRIMRALVKGLIVAVLAISLTVLATQILEQPVSQFDSLKQPTSRTRARIPFTKRDLASARLLSEQHEQLLRPQEVATAAGATHSWYDGLVSPFAGMFGLEEVSPDDELTILIDSKELKRVKKGYVNYSKPKAQQNATATATEPSAKNTIHSVIASRRRHTFFEGAQLAEGAVAQVNLSSLIESELVGNKNNNSDSESFRAEEVASALAINDSNNNVALIDKIKGIDLDFSKMGGDHANSKQQRQQQEQQPQNEEQHHHQQQQQQQQQQQPHEQSRWNRDVKCNTNKYDRLIAQKISLNEISRPVVTSNGRYDNPFSTWSHPTLVDSVKFIMLETDESNVPKDQDELYKELPMEKPDFSIPEGDEHEFKVTWIGHSTLVIQIDGLNILTDPIFSNRASPSQFLGPKRIREPACKIKDLPPIDAVVISHNHYDHLDADSVNQLNDRFGSDCRWIVPLGLGEFLRSMSVENYVELDWWQKDCFSTDQVSSKRLSLTAKNATTTPEVTRHVVSRSLASTSNNLNDNSSSPKSQALRQKRPELNIYLTPSQHWSRRGVNDFNKSLWGSYTIVSANDSTFFFGGDTAYCTAFKEVAKVFGPLTGAAIPIGAYKPRWFLKGSHVDPHEAVQIHRDLKSSKSMAIHHSTFILSNEHYKEPAAILKEIMSDLKSSGSVMEPFVAFNHGQSGMFRKIIRTPKL